MCVCVCVCVCVCMTRAHLVVGGVLEISRRHNGVLGDFLLLLGQLLLIKLELGQHVLALDIP